VREPPPTFGELKNIYGLRVLDNSWRSRSSFDAVGHVVPGLHFYFGRPAGARNVDEFTLGNLSGPASVILPEYIGMIYERIPGFFMAWGHGGFFDDSYGHYVVTFSHVNQRRLGTNDDVLMDWSGEAACGAG
jgi:hypothetical protein